DLKKTQKLMCKFKKFLENVSGERVNEELFKILSCRRSYPVIKKMDELRIIDEIIPYIDEARGVSQGGYHHLDVWSHSLETLRQFELFYRKKLVRNSEILSYLNEELAQGRQRIQIVKLACILHDIGKSFARQKKGKKTIFHTHEKIGRDLAGIIAHKLRLSLREKEVLKKLIYWHLRPGYLADQAVPSQRAIYHFFRDAEDEGVGVILVSLSDWRATRGPLIDLKKRKKHEKVMLKLIDYYFQEKKRVPLHKIVDGYDIMKKFNLTPGPLIGKILKKIKEEQALGKISAKREAYKIAKTHLHLRGASGGAREEK
ncbi:MAG: HD domain-containing protein, partial [Candidatus Omnitrophica bacterium]|nr:HD domain-containing protein [Candidatus Omnitrophota bacterium]